MRTVTKKILSAFTALSIALTPFSTSAASYFYRFHPTVISVKSDGSNPGGQDPGPVNPGPDQGELKKIEASFSAIVGQVFSQGIPYADQRVARWQPVSGTLPTGFTFNSDTGLITGTSQGVESATFFLNGFDIKNTKIIEAKITISSHEIAGQTQTFSYYTHTNQPFERALPTVAGLAVKQWKAETVLPPGLELDALSGVLRGTATTSGISSIVASGLDMFGNVVLTVKGDLKVEDGPTIEFVRGQTIDLSKREQFDITPVVGQTLGPVSFRLIAVGAEHAGLTFDGTTGKLGGKFPAFNMSGLYRIEVRDGYDGSIGISNVFELKTANEVVSLASIGNMTGYLDEAFTLQLTTQSGNAPVDSTWAISAGTLPAGIQLNPQTGLLSGTPTAVGSKTGLKVSLTSSSVMVESAAFNFDVIPKNLELKGSTTTAVAGRPFTTPAVTVVSGDTDGLTFSVNETLPSLLSFDTATGTFSSTGLPAGNYDAWVTATNKIGATANASVLIRINNDPDLKYTASSTVQRLKTLNLTPTFKQDSFIGSKTFKVLEGTLPSFASFNTSTGQLLVAPTLVTDVQSEDYGPFVVEATDSTGEKYRANSFTFKVIDRDQLVLKSSDLSMYSYVDDRAYPVTVENALGPVTYELVEGQQNLPSSVSFHASGFFYGKALVSPGTTVGGIVIRAADTNGGLATFGPFSLSFEPANDLAPLAGSFDKTYSWTMKKQFSDFALAKPTNSFGPLTYAIDGDLPFGVSLVDGKLSGTVFDAGTHLIKYTVKDDTNRVARGTITLVISPELDLSIAPIFVSRATQVDVPVKPTGGKAPYTLSFDNTSRLPLGMSWDAINKKVTGIPREEGVFTFQVNVADSLGSTANSGPVTIDVGPGPTFSFNYDPIVVVKNSFLNYKPDIPGGSGSYTFSVKKGYYSEGLSFSSSNGQLAGIARTAAIYSFTVAATDNVFGGQFTQDVSLVVQPDIPMSITQPNQSVRAGASVTINRPTVTGNYGRFTFELWGLETTGLAIDPTTGTTTGTPTKTGTFNATVRATDEMGRTASTSFAVVIVDGLSINVPTENNLQYNKTVAQAALVQPTASNSVGSLSWSIGNASQLPPGVSFNTALGKFEGTPTALGGYGPVTLSVSDSQMSTTSPPIYFTVYMNSDPIVLDVSGAVGKVGMSVSNPAPSYSNSISGTRFFANNLGGTNLTLDQSTGVLTGSFSTAAVHNIDLTITDDTGRETTKQVPFDIKARMAVSAAATATLDVGVTMTAIPVTRTNAYGASTWDAVTSGLPPGVTFNTTTGQFEGKPTTAGTYGPVKVTGRDSLGDLATTSGTTFTVRASGHVYWRIADSQTQGNWWWNTSGGQIGTSYTGADVAGSRFQGWGAMTSTWFDETRGDVTALKVRNTGLPATGFNVTDAIWAVSGFADPWQLKRSGGTWYKAYKFSEPVNINKVTWTWGDSQNALYSAILFPVIQYSDDGTNWTTAWSSTITRSTTRPQGTQKP